MPWKVVLALAGLALVAPVAQARVAPAPDPAAEPRALAAADRVKLVRVGRFSDPVEVVAPPGETRRIYVVEQSGRVRVMTGRRKHGRPFLDITGRVLAGGERGLLSLAFHPDFAQNRRFYVYFTDNQGDIRIEQYTAASDTRADRSSGRLVLEIRHRRYANHNGGHLEFGPDGLLYASTGDGGGAGDPLRAAQRLSSPLGKLLRLDPQPGGGFRSPAGNVRGPVYAYGLRNPWRFSFDVNGDITIGDVGQDAVEEVNFLRRGRARGANFGWSVWEGRRRFRSGSARGHVRPVIQRSHRAGNCGVVGGVIVRDRSLRDLLGHYVYGDLCNSRLRAARLRSGRATRHRSLPISVRGLSSFGRDGRGRVYATSLSRAAVYRLARR